MIASIRCLCLLCILTGTALAQGAPPLITYEEYSTWMKGAKVAGWSCADTEQDGEEYTAMFTAGSSYMQVRLGPLSSFDDPVAIVGGSTPERYTWEGFRVIYAEGKEQSILVIEHPALNATFFLGAMHPQRSKKVMESFAKDLGILSRGASVTNPWPAEIASEYRIAGRIVDITKMPPSTDGMEYEFEVRMLWDKEARTSVENLLKRFRGTLQGTSLGPYLFICAQGDDLDQVDRDTKPGESVKFIYYRKAH